jgi:branched-chain amino acid transport system substrate-binding protein
MGRQYNRRQLVKGIGAAGVAGIAGCSGTGGGDGDGGDTPTSDDGGGDTPTATATGTADSGSDEPILIGTNYPLSGGLALNGQDATRGVEIAVNEINANGGIDGRQIELIKRDAQDADTGVSNVESLATSENVDVIVGSFSSSIAQASAEAAARYDVLYWETTGFSPQISEPGYQHLYHCNTRTTQYGEEGGRIIDGTVAPRLDKSTSELRLGIMYENGVFGTATNRLVQDQAEEYGYNVVESIGYPPFDTNDLSSSIERLRQANIDVLYHSGYNADTNLLWQQAADLDLYVPAVVGNGTAYVVQSFVEAVGQQTALGIINVDQPHYNVGTDFAPGMENILTSYREAYGEAPVTQLPATAYSCTKMLEQVISEADSFGLDDFEEAALSVSEPNGTFANGWGLEFDDEFHRNQNVTVAGTQWQPDEFTEDLYHPEARPDTLDTYGVYPEDAAVDYTEIGDIPRPDYTQ